MKRRYNDGGKLPSAEEAAKTAVLEPTRAEPLTDKQRMAPMRIGKPSDVSSAERRKIERDMKMAAEPVKRAKGGTASSRADGCAQRGKTRGKMV